MRLPYKNGACRLTSPFGERVLNGVTEWHGGVDLVGMVHLTTSTGQDFI